MIGAVYRAHVRLALRDWAIWVTTILTLALVKLAGGMGLINLMGTGSGPGLVLPMFFLGLMLAAAGAAQGDHRASLNESLEALPYRPVDWVVGRLLALCVPWLAAGTLLVLFAALMGVHQGGLRLHPLALWVWCVTMPVGVLFSSAVGWTLGRLFPRGFAPHLLAVLLAVTGGMPFLFEIVADMARINPPTVFDWTLSNYFAFSPFGHFPDGALLLLNRLFLIGCGVAGSAWTVWVLARRGRRPGGWPALATGISGTTLAVAVVMLSSGIWSNRMDNYQTELAAYSGPVREPAAPNPAVTGYNVSLQLSPKTHSLKAKAVVHLDKVRDTAAFTLRSVFDVAAVSGPDGQPVTFSRDGDWLTLNTGSRPGDYTIHYSGVVWQWRPYARLYTMWLGAHISEQSVLLPSNYGWYPLPGGYRLSQPTEHCKGTCGKRLVDYAVEHPPAAFTLQVLGAGDRPVITNATGQAPVTAAWIISTPGASSLGVFRTDDPGPVQAHMTFYEGLWPIPDPLAVMEVPESYWHGRQLQYLWQSAFGFRGAVLFTTGVSEMASPWSLQKQLFHAWWGEPRNAEESLAQSVLWVFALELIEGEVGRVRGQAAFLGVPRWETAHLEALDQLRQFYRAGGMEATKGLLRRLHEAAASQPLTLKRLKAVMSEGAS